MSKEPPETAYTPEGQEHAREARTLQQMLSEEMGVPFQRVYPTMDMSGKVTLNFRQVWNLLGYPEGFTQYEASLKDEE